MLGIVGEGEGIASEILTDLGVELVELCQKVVELLPDARPGGYAMYSPLATAVRGGVYRLTSFRRLWYRYPGRWVFPLSRGWTAPYLVRGDVSAGYLDRFPDHHSSSRARP